MKLKNNSKRVEKNFTYSVVDIVLVVDQTFDERGVYTRLTSKYKLAYTDDDSLSKFVSSIKKDPLKYYRRHFCFNAPIISRVFINPVSHTNYCIGTVSSRKGYLVLSEYTNLSIDDMYKHSRNLIQYQPIFD